MEKIYIIILLIIIAVGVYLFVRNNNTGEHFTALVGTSKPLVTYDDYGTFNFIFHTNDLPYYDPTYDVMSDYTKNRLDATTCEKFTPEKFSSEDFDKDSFFELCGYKIRKSLVPSNYAETDGAHFTKFAIHSNMPEQEKMSNFKNICSTSLTDTDRAAPEPFNYYFRT